MQTDLLFLLENKKCECLNEDDDHPLKNALDCGPKYLESDCDEQVNHIAVSVIIWMNTNAAFLYSHTNPNTNIAHNFTSFQAPSQTSLTATHWTK